MAEPKKTPKKRTVTARPLPADLPDMPLQALEPAEETNRPLTKKKKVRKKTSRTLKKPVVVQATDVVTKSKTKPEGPLTFGVKDRILLTYQSRWYDIVSVPGIIVRANREKGYPFKLKLQDEDGKVIPLGHDDDGGEPGSGPYMYVDTKHLTLVEKHVPKKLEGDTKTDWKVGDKFMVKDGFSPDQDEDDDITGVVEEMMKGTGMELTVAAIITRLGPTWLLDGSINYCWLPKWVDAIE